MKKRVSDLKLNPVFYVLLYFFIVTSCVQKENKHNDVDFEKKEVSNTISEIESESIAALYEANQKILDICDVGFQNVKDVEVLKLIISLKNEHLKLNEELENISEKNLIIIPKTISEITFKEDSLKSKNVNNYILTLLEKNLRSQIKNFKIIEQNSINFELKKLSTQTKLRLEKNQTRLLKVDNQLS